MAAIVGMEALTKPCEVELYSDSKYLVPRILIAMLAGAAVAVSGVMLQAVMKNPLADPGIMGISSGAGMAAVLVTAFAPSLYLAVPAFAFLGGVFACGLVYLLSWKGDLSPLRVILTGVAVNAFFTGLMSAPGFRFRRGGRCRQLFGLSFSPAGLRLR